MTTINKNTANDKILSIINNTPKVPRLCDIRAWPRQGGTVIEYLWNGFEVKTAHPYSKVIDNLFEALLHEFEATNYDVFCTGKEKRNENMLTASIYIIEKD